MLGKKGNTIIGSASVETSQNVREKTTKADRWPITAIVEQI